MQLISNVNTRLVFENAKAAMANVGFDVNAYKLTQSFLRVERALVVNQSAYNFPIMVDQSLTTQFNTEQRLNLQDSFVISEIQFFIGVPSSSTDFTFRKLTYPNPYFLTDEATARSVGGVYNGKMRITVNNNILVTAWDIDRHYYSPETQQTAAWGAGSPLDEYDGSTNGFYPMEPNIVLVGSKKNEIDLILPAGIAAGFPANTRIGFEFRGILAQNSTVVS